MPTTLPTGGPEIVDIDFPLGRKLAFSGNCWVVTSRLTGLVANRASFLILPNGTRSLVVTRAIIASEAVAFIPRIGTATALNTPVPLTPLNMNVTSANVASFTALSSSVGAPTTPNFYYQNSLTAAADFWDITFGSPFYLPNGSTTGFLIDTGAAFTGNLEVNIEVQEYPY